MLKKKIFAAAVAAIIGCSSAFTAFAETTEDTYETEETGETEETYEESSQTEEPSSEEPSTEETDEPSPAIWFDFYTTELYVGESVSLGARIVYGEWENPVIIFESTDESIVTVDESGYVTAVGEGTAYVMSTYEDLYTYATIIVTQPEYVPEHIGFERGSFDLKIGETAQIEARVLPDNGENNAFTYVSSDPDVAIVNERGFITALKMGSTVITVSGAGLTGQVTVNVTSSAVDTVSLNGYLYSGGSPAQGVQLVMGGLISVTDANGFFSFGQVPCREITISAADDANAFCTVTPQVDTTLYLLYENGAFTVRSSLEEIGGSTPAPTLSVSFTTGASIIMAEGETFELAYRCEPQDVPVTGIAYSTSNAIVAEVGQLNGIITARSAGEVDITLSLNNGQARAVCHVVVNPKEGSKYGAVIIAAVIAAIAAITIVVLTVYGSCKKKRAPDLKEYDEETDDDSDSDNDDE